jgi:hypothetical protein
MAEKEIGEAKTCPQCDVLQNLEQCFYKKPGTFDGHRDICIECSKANAKANYKAKKPQASADDIIHQIESGEFEVDQKWLLKELITQYKDPKCRDRLKALDMIMKVSGYNTSSTDDKAIMDSLLESLKNGNS